METHCNDPPEILVEKCKGFVNLYIYFGKNIILRLY